MSSKLYDLDAECASCHVISRNMSRCGGCSALTYCSVGCQRQHWSVHKFVGFTSTCFFIPSHAAGLRQECLARQPFDDDTKTSGKLLDAFAVCHSVNIRRSLEVIRLCTALRRLPMGLKDHFLHIVLKPRPSAAIVRPPSKAYSITDAAIRTLDSWSDLDPDMAALIRNTPNSDPNDPSMRRIIILIELPMLHSITPNSPNTISLDSLLMTHMTTFMDPSPLLIRAMSALVSSPPPGSRRSVSLEDIGRLWLEHLKDKVRRGHMEHNGTMGKLVRFKKGWRWNSLSDEEIRGGDYSESWKGLPRSLCQLVM